MVRAEAIGVSAWPMSSKSDFSFARGLEAEFHLLSQTYMSSGEPAFSADAGGENLAFGLALKNEFRLPYKAHVKMDVSDRYSTSEQWNYLDVHELYASFEQDGASLSVGRKLDTWAEWETQWQQGVFQPRYMQDPLAAEAAGLTGLFLQTRQMHWETTVAALPVNIPDFGPHFYVRDDKFYSRNPWFQAPASEFLYNHVPSELHYTLQMPDLAEVVMKPGVAAKTQYHIGDFLTRVSYAYKPAPQLALGCPSDGLVRLPNYAKVTIIPRVVYDRVINIDEVYARGPWRLSGSVAYDNPESDHGPAGWTTQNYSPAWIFSAQAARSLGDRGPHAPLVEVGFLRVAGGDGPDTGGLADDQQTKFTRRFEYYEAYSLGYKKEWRLGLRRPLTTSAHVIYDRLQNGGVFSFNAGYSFERNWQVELGLDFIGLLSNQPAEVNDGFLAAFRANDRVALGVNYVF
jgi:hypothetical protein